MVSYKQLLIEVAQYLETQGVGTVASNIFKGSLADKPTKAVAVLLSGGPRLRGDPIHRPSMQILVRDPAFDVGLVRAQDIYSLLDHTADKLTSIRGRCLAVTEPGSYYRDANSNYIFPMNYTWYLNP